MKDMSTENDYRIPHDTRIGHVHLKVSNIQKSLDFYCGLLGFELTTTYGDDAAFISAGGYHHHIGLNIWYSRNGQPPPPRSTGLFHVAILYPSRKDLAAIFRRLLDKGYPIEGASDHGVSEAIYLHDPDQNGIELYFDKPESQWPHNPDGSLDMYTRKLDLEGLLSELS
jgi:catechol 2,3-dioxygenase